jgi:2-hydroxy-3-oxopropionate reductase
MTAGHSEPARTPTVTGRVGVIGVGIMGGPMARNLLKAGAAVSVHHRSPERVKDLLDQGAGWAASPRELAAECSVIILMLGDAPQILEVLNGPDGVAAGITAPATLVICSSISAGDARRIAAQAEKATGGLLRTIDAPVSGGEEGAIAGNLSIMAGGDPTDYAQVAPALQACGRPVLLGPLGAGSVAKACNQLIVAATVMALGEASVIAHRAGIDVAKLLELLSGGYAGSRVLETRARRFAEEDYSPSGMAKFMVKDLASAEDAAASASVDAGQLRYLHQAFTELVQAGHGDEDIAVTRAFVDEKSKMHEKIKR